jgi:hypothetical protein
MAYETFDLYVRPEEGWVEVAADPDNLLIRPENHHPWFLAVTDGSAPQTTSSQATGSIVFAGLPLDTETVTVGDTTYTFVAALAAANDILIGSDAEETRDNLLAAINGAAGEGTLYGTGTVANVGATGAATGLDTIDLTSVRSGTAGNDIALSEAATNVTVSGAALTGGAEPLIGLPFGRGNDNARDGFEVNGAIVGNVYIRIRDPIASTPGARMRFGVIRNQ